jgi:large subunit ribosomal protein L24e
MVKCSFCLGTVREGRGKVYVKTDGKILNFCDSKCRKNWGMGRTGKKIKWTPAHSREKGKSK